MTRHQCVAPLPFICALQCRLLIAVAALVFMVAPRSVFADVTTDTLNEIARCSTIDENSERLRCFDRAAPRARAALTPQPQDFGKPTPPPPELPQLNAAVLELARTTRGRAVFVLDNGQTWRQIEGDDTYVAEPPPGESLKVTIAKGLFGSYNLTIDGRNTLIKVRRVE